MSEQTNQETDREYTEAELNAMREKTIKYYAQQKKVLTSQCEVEELKARIKKAQFEAFDYTVRMMQINQAIKEAEDEVEQKSE
jgi:hypothetical protein